MGQLTTLVRQAGRLLSRTLAQAHRRNPMKSMSMPTPDQAIPDRTEIMPVPARHLVLGSAMSPPWPENLETAMFGMGCFWGAERMFWRADGVCSTQVGYAGGYSQNPTYGDVCSGMTGHAEVVRIQFDPDAISYRQMLKLFWEGHDPTQYHRQGNDMGTQYRSCLFFYDNQQQELAESSHKRFQQLLDKSGQGKIESEFMPAKPFYYAEPEHQQYLARNPNGYCGLGGLEIACGL